MSVNASIPGSSSQVLPLSIRNVFPLRVLEALRQAKVNDEHTVLVVFLASNQEVIRLNVSVNDPFFVHFLNSLQLFQCVNI